MLQKVLVQNRFFTATHTMAVLLALVAAVVNVFVGPFNAAMWLVPVFMAGYALIASFLVQGALLQADRPFEVHWMVRAVMGKRLGKRAAYLSHCLYRKNTRVVTPVFLYVVPSFFFALALILLVLSVQGQIEPGS